MQRGKRTESPAYAQYVQQLKKLNVLIATGKGDSDEADAIRDQMDEPWKNMSPEEIERVDKL